MHIGQRIGHLAFAALAFVAAVSVAYLPQPLAEIFEPLFDAGVLNLDRNDSIGDGRQRTLGSCGHNGLTMVFIKRHQANALRAGRLGSPG